MGCRPHRSRADHDHGHRSTDDQSTISAGSGIFLSADRNLTSIGAAHLAVYFLPNDQSKGRTDRGLEGMRLAGRSEQAIIADTEIHAAREIEVEPGLQHQ